MEKKASVSPRDTGLYGPRELREGGYGGQMVAEVVTALRPSENDFWEVQACLGHDRLSREARQKQRIVTAPLHWYVSIFRNPA